MRTDLDLNPDRFSPDLESALRTQDGAYEVSRNILKRLVALEQVDRKTVAAAVESIAREGRFGSWAVKLFKGEKVKVLIHQYFQLCHLLEVKAVEHERRLARERELLRALRGSDAASSCHSALAGGDRRARLHAV